MSAQNYNDLYAHRGHSVEVHTYYDENVAIECNDCHEVLLDFDNEQTAQSTNQDSISWGELALLTHATQVERFGWCSCEEQEQFPYDDCPREERVTK